MQQSLHSCSLSGWGARMDFVHPVSSVIPGAQGQVLAVLAETSAELNLRTVARLAGVSASQASRVIPGLVDLGLVERREVPPSTMGSSGRCSANARTRGACSRRVLIAQRTM
ncbi:helix-turn-helix domain-containing protein [Candidatus Poriferisodalis sp.]|uniref:helix-turn-helix domain-containing protein n=1 Tax=Candidatus Poriferisodalis sp. TaxID=3101277 RepID=UPI003B02786B